MQEALSLSEADGSPSLSLFPVKCVRLSLRKRCDEKAAFAVHTYQSGGGKNTKEATAFDLPRTLAFCFSGTRILKVSHLMILIQW